MYEEEEAKLRQCFEKCSTEYRTTELVVFYSKVVSYSDFSCCYIKPSNGMWYPGKNFKDAMNKFLIDDKSKSSASEYQDIDYRFVNIIEAIGSITGDTNFSIEHFGRRIWFSIEHFGRRICIGADSLENIINKTEDDLLTKLQSNIIEAENALSNLKAIAKRIKMGSVSDTLGE